ncbi:MAG: FecR domain-containing protein [Opitutae bacterium]|nr:FecR domain-containing protein [Opitutae bacterium]
MNSTGQQNDILNEQVAQWLERRDAGLTAEQRLEFERWLEANPAHEEAFAQAAAMWDLIHSPAADNRDQLRGELRTLNHRRWRRRGLAMAALIAVGFFVSTLWHRPAAPDLQAPLVATTTRLLVPTQQVLPDGSTVELSPDSRIAVQFDAGQRRVLLQQGDAFFAVKKDSARPFIVVAGAVSVKAVGTAFAVSLAPRNVDVLVTEGRVAVEAAATPNTTAPAAPTPVTFVNAGNRLSVIPERAATEPEPQVEPVSPEECEHQLSWRAPRIEFTNTSVGDAVEQFNRQGKTRLIVRDPAVSAMRVTGVFRVDNAKGFAGLLVSGFGLTAEPEGDNAIVLAKRR